MEEIESIFIKVEPCWDVLPELSAQVSPLEEIGPVRISLLPCWDISVELVAQS
jgi:hypothetical protein